MTNKAIFGLKLASLSEASGFPLSKVMPKEAKLKFRSFKNPNETYEVDIPYTYEGIGLVGKDLDRKDPNPKIVSSYRAAQEKDPSEQYAPHTTSIIYKGLNLFRTEVPNIQSEFGSVKNEKEYGIGQKIQIGSLIPSFKLPKNFKRIEVPPQVLYDPKFSAFFSPDSFFAGTFLRHGKRVGFLRIPSYSASSIGAIGTTIRYYIARLQAESDYLVIDQTNNPGGMVIMSDMLLKALCGKYNPERHMHFSVKPSQGFIRQYLELRDSIAKNEDNLLSPEEVMDFVSRLDKEYEKIYKAYTEGRDLTDPISMLVLSEYSEKTFDKALFKLPWGPIFKAMLGVNIQEAQTYTKPVYFMINELDFSGGDATPAGFQDYGRGKLVGTHENGRTAGAGGTVEEFSIRSVIEMALHWTTSLMVRPGGKLVENYGVHADFSVPLTQQDIANNQANYFDRVLTRIEADMAQGGQAQK